jgi:hypothetical protein
VTAVRTPILGERPRASDALFDYTLAFNGRGLVGGRLDQSMAFYEARALEDFEIERQRQARLAAAKAVA